MSGRHTRSPGALKLMLCAVMLITASPAEAQRQAMIVFSDATAGNNGSSEVFLERTLPVAADPWTGFSTGGVTIEDSTEGEITILVESLSTTGGTPTASDNDFTRINEALQSVTVLGDGTTVRLVGTFDWTETNALASWVAADFAVIAPTGVADVRVHATSLGEAVIEGPGELTDPAIYYEGFLHLLGGTFQGWTIENLLVRGFDWSIGMFYDSLSGSTVDFNGVTVRNNRIEMHPDEAGDLFQNIGLHLGYGTNQTVDGNEIVIPGTGVSAGPVAAASIGMQSNSAGGSVYDELSIIDNTIRITGAQVIEAEGIVGIWENALSHASDIEISGNSFVNEDPANDPAANLQRAFRVTSHSSASTTVRYVGNISYGANIGIHWLGDAFFSNPPATVEPVLVLSNTLVDNHTGVWAHTDDLAPGPGGDPTNMSKALLQFNRIVGNETGVRSDDAEVTAEDNWWGCNDGPGTGGCDAAFYSGTEGFLDVDPWLVLGLTTVPDIVPVGGQSVATADLRFNSDGVDTSGGGTIPDDTPVEFTATGGTVDPSFAGTVLGQAITTYTAGAAPGEFDVNASVDLADASSPVTVTGVAALALAMLPELQIRGNGETADVTVTIANFGPDPAAELDVTVDFPTELTGLAWTCVGSGGGSCTSSGAGDISDIADLPTGASVVYTAMGEVPDPFVGILSVTGSVTPPIYVSDPDPSDNSATVEIRSLSIFADGFESGDTSAWSSTVP